MSLNDVTATNPPTSADPAPSDTAAPDRLGVHILLEAVLAIVFAGALFWLYLGDSPLTTVAERDALITAMVPLLLLSIAVAVSLRVGAVNLACGAVAVAGAVMFAENSGRGTAVALLAAVGVAVAVGLVLSLLVVALRVPAWLASAVVAAVTMLWVFERVTIAQLSSDPLPTLATSNSWIWLISVGALSIFGGVVAALNGWRTRLGLCREVNANSRTPDATSNLVTIGVMVMSSLLAGLAGVWTVWTATDGAIVVEGLNPLLVTVFPLAAALLGGTSAFGRRGGILGTLLAALLLMTVLELIESRGWPLHPMWVLLGAIVVGLIITRLVESLGRPREVPETVAPVAETSTEPLPSRQPGPDAEYASGDIDPYRRYDLDAHR
ncbi:monosaccharide ABC transporter membrane protein (CUT2 family) [Stackebrandtia endophytica]|uniref:Monosaccharide ABC transporter membrane protein (CUT2 family) n=1 Tax=Stackebrandtia endophytica TaxID=1496996 RepID=A0A543AYJ9_9ACTN|nr:hypothetical protein [Stackebrandtia endophytica]TQL77648.1 monosaccharide ABC transporter membrane protein (CUT2 family) [Stackebrandtia endophytica]